MSFVYKLKSCKQFTSPVAHLMLAINNLHTPTLDFICKIFSITHSLTLIYNMQASVGGEEEKVEASVVHISLPIH